MTGRATDLSSWGTKPAPCPPDAPGRPSSTNGRHQEQPANMQEPRAFGWRATHGKALVMRRSAGPLHARLARALADQGPITWSTPRSRAGNGVHGKVARGDDVDVAAIGEDVTAVDEAAAAGDVVSMQVASAP